MGRERLVIREVVSGKERYMGLLLEGDEQEEMVERYLGRGRLFVMESAGKTVAVCVVTDEGDGVCEIKNIAVAREVRRHGYGRRMVEEMIATFRPQFDVMLVGTGETPGTLAFYRSCGFECSHRVEGFFTDNYDHEIVEEGVTLKDMVYLKLGLKLVDV